MAEKVTNYIRVRQYLTGSVFSISEAEMDPDNPQNKSEPTTFYTLTSAEDDASPYTEVRVPVVMDAPEAVPVVELPQVEGEPVAVEVDDEKAA